MDDQVEISLQFWRIHNKQRISPDGKLRLTTRNPGFAG
jgi:hypothetical protein